MAEAPSPYRRRRTVQDLKGLPRTAFGSDRYRAAEVMAEANRPPLSHFAPSAVLEWIRAYLAYVFRPKHKFIPASNANQNAVYSLGGDDGSPVRVAVAGDWGTGTDEAEAVAHRMCGFNAAYTIHLGDVYYVGDPPAVNENCLGIVNPINNYDPVRWPFGTVGSFAMNGNHEMYANGVGYFDVLLPRFGIKHESGERLRQQTSFFCLQNKFWRIIAIDTGYNSIGVPILSQIPIVNSIPAIGGNCKLPGDLIDWLKNTLQPESDQRGLVILSHHQYYSAFEASYRKPAKQLFAAGVKRPAVWFWGHEHRLAGYGLTGSDDLKAYGRCVGHGGMPVELGRPKHRSPKPVFYDDRVAENTFGVNGHVNLTFTGNKLNATYIDLDDKKLFEETWEVDGTGAVTITWQKKWIQSDKFYFDPTA